MKHSLLGGTRISKISLEDQMLSREAVKDVRYQYLNEYDPKIFIDLLIENDIKVIHHSKEGFPSTAVHTSFEEVMELINKNCINFINKVDKKKETIMLIPIFTEQGCSGLTKVGIIFIFFLRYCCRHSSTWSIRFFKYFKANVF